MKVFYYNTKNTGFKFNNLIILGLVKSFNIWRKLFDVILEVLSNNNFVFFV